MNNSILMMSLLILMPAFAQNQKQLENNALSGDYQAQRNLAYSYVAPMKGEELDLVSGCAWYLVILRSGSKRVNVSDTNNATSYCGRLSKTEQIAAYGKADGLVRRIYNK